MASQASLGAGLFRTAAGCLPETVYDDPEQDHDHAHEGDEVGRQLRRGVLVEVVDVSRRLEMSYDVRQPAQDEDHQAGVDERRKAEELAACPF
jgi:hypothetical protein